MRLFLIILTSVVCTNLSAKAKKDTIWIKAELKPNEVRIFNSLNRFGSITISLKNKSNLKALIYKEVLTSRPLHLFTSELFIDNTGNQKNIIKNYVVVPGDTLVLTAEKKSTCDSLLDFSTSPIPQLSGNTKKMFDEIQLPGYLNRIKVAFDENEKRIYNTHLSKKLKEAFASLNYNFKSASILYFSLKKLNSKNSELISSEIKTLTNNLALVDRINSPLNLGIYYSIIKYSAMRTGNNESNYWKFYKDANPNLKVQPFFKRYFLMQLHSTYDNKASFFEAYLEQAKNIGIAQTDIDLFLKEAKAPESEFLSDNNLLAAITASKLLETTDGIKASIESFIANSKSGYTVVDFWASWCVPCRIEAPTFFKLANQNKNISFVQISIDDDLHIKEWQKAIVDARAPSSVGQYRILNPKESKFANLLSLKSIPRYIILNAKGELVSYDAPRPTNPDLKKLLDSLSKN